MIQMLLLCIFKLFLITSAQASHSATCGTYNATGRLVVDVSGISHLVLNAGTPEHMSILLHGLSVEDRTGLNGKDVLVPIEIYYAKNRILRAHVRGVLKPSFRATSENSLIVIQREVCKD